MTGNLESKAGFSAVDREKASSEGVPFSTTQTRIFDSLKGLPPCPGMLSGVTVQIANVHPVERSLVILRQVCRQIDSLTCRPSPSTSEWLLDRSDPGDPVREIVAETRDLSGYLEYLARSSDTCNPSAPLTIHHIESSPAGWTCFVAIGAARCDLEGLEILIRRWLTALDTSPPNRAVQPSLLQVQRALDRTVEGADARSAERYWRPHCAGPADANETAASSCRAAGGRFAPCSIQIDGARALLSTPSQRYDVSQRTVLLAAWLFVLSRVLGSRHPRVWFQVDGRLAPGLNDFVGQLAHRLPLSLRVDPEEACIAFLLDIERTVSLHERLQDSFNSPLTLAAADRARLRIDFEFAFRNTSWVDVSASIIERHEGGEPYSLRLSAQNDGAGCDATLFFDSQTIRPEQGEYLASEIARVIRAMSDADVSVSALCAGSFENTQRLMRADCAAPRREWISGDRIGEMLLSGLRSAVIFATDEKMPTESLLARVLHRAAQLRRRCDGSADPMIALVAHTSVEAATTFVGALLEGIAVALIDPRWPEETRSEAISTVGASLVIGDWVAPCASPLTAEYCSFAELNGTTVVPEGTAQQVRDRPSLRGVAYVVFTSGSTGVPKSALVPRSALQNQLLWLQERLPLDKTDVVLHRSPLGFDAAIWELLHTLCSGAIAAIPHHELAGTAEAIVDHVLRHGVTVLQLTPHLLRAVNDLRPFPGSARLRLIVCGGDRLLRRVAEGAVADAECELVNAYGPSECCIQVSIETVNGRSIPASLSSASIGEPMPNCGMHILTDDLEPALDGTIGRLFISGTPVGYGYAANPQASADAFVPMAGASARGERMYDTGDLARRVDGRCIEIVGRAGGEIKLNGVRVNLPAVERVLYGLAVVDEVSVVAVSDEVGSGYLTAFLVTSSAGADVADAARRRAAAMLPQTFQPAHYLCLERLPLNERGKIDKKALVEHAREAATPPKIPPRTAVERSIADVWKGVLKIDDVGIRDDFFLSGGHSLLFAQVIVRLRQAFSLEISLRAIFMHPTIESLAQHIEELRRLKPGSDASQVRSADENGA